MTLDVWLVARLAAELNAVLAGARIRAVSGDSHGLMLTCHRRGQTLSVRATFAQEGPLIAVHRDVEPENENVAGGWAGGVAPLLRGCSVESVQAVPGDRILFVDVVSRSAFGVPARHRITFELEPNKANILVLRRSDEDRWRILAAAKVIEGSEGARSITVGAEYEPPPPRRSRLDRDSFAAAVAEAADATPRALSRLLSDFDPMCSTPLARETIDRANASDAAGMPDRLLSAWRALRADVSAAASDLDARVYAWQTSAGFGVVHVVRLSWPEGALTVLRSLNDACVAQQIGAAKRRQAPVVAAVRKRLVRLIDRCDVEIASLRAAQQRGTEADALRVAGDAIYTHLAEITERADAFVTPAGLRVELDPALSAKENAASYFRRFKKARSGLPRVAARLATLQHNKAFWESLSWELERAESASAEELATVSGEIADALGTRSPKQRRRPRKQRAEHALALPDDALAYVGRSPKDNERVTFTIGAPNDLWFHARGIPGAHVILKLPDGRKAASDEQVAAAAALAAGQSRAADAGKVEVDYTQRKHVRKQGGDRVGQVWYTDFKTVLVAPRKLSL